MRDCPAFLLFTDAKYAWCEHVIREHARLVHKDAEPSVHGARGLIIVAAGTRIEGTCQSTKQQSLTRYERVAPKVP